MNEEKEMTAPFASVGADAEQSSKKYTFNSINETVKNINGFEKIQRVSHKNLKKPCLSIAPVGSDGGNQDEGW